MRDKKQTLYGVGLTLLILLSLTSQRVGKINTWSGQRLSSCYTNHLTKTFDKNQTFYQSRDLVCNSQEINEVLCKSKKNKILVTQQD